MNIPPDYMMGRFWGDGTGGGAKKGACNDSNYFWFLFCN